MSLVIGKALSAGAKQVVLESKVLAVREGILALASGTGSSLPDITTLVLAVSKNDTYTSLTNGSQKGVYVGAVANAASPFKVHIRANGTDNGIEDGLGDEIYGILSESAGVVSLAFLKSNGTAHTFGVSVPLDIFYVEFCDFYQADPAALLLLGGISGVVDATASSALGQLIDDLASTDNGFGASLIGVEDPDDKIVATTVEGAVVEIATNLETLITDLASVANGEGASLVGVEDLEDNFTATTVEGILAELAASDSLIATAAQELIAAEADVRTAQVGHLVALSGVAADAENLGEFTGATIADDSTIKAALQALETAVEASGSGSDITALVTLTGVAAGSTNLGEFGGNILNDNLNIKQALQQLENYAGAQTIRTDLITLTAQNLIDKWFDLALPPTVQPAVILYPYGHLPQLFDEDFTIGGVTQKRVLWSGRGMDDLGLVAGNKIRVIYQAKGW